MGKTENKETNSRLTENEEKISYLIKDVEDLSEIVAKQGFELEKLITGKTIREAIQFIDEVHLDILTPITDLRAPAAYRKTASKILIQRSIASFENIDEAE